MSNTVVSIAVGRGPAGIAVSPDGKHAYVTQLDDRNVSLIDLVAAHVTATCTVRGTPRGVTVAAGGRRVFVADTDVLPAGSGRIDVIEPDPFRVVSGIAFGDSANAIALLTNGRLAVTDFQARAAVTVDPLSGSSRRLDLSGVGSPGALMPGPGGTFFVSVAVAGQGGALIGVDGNGGLGSRFDLDFVPGRGAVSPNGRTLYLCDPANGRLHPIAIGAAPTPDPIDVDDGVSDVAVTPDGRLLHVLGVDRLWTLDATEHQPVGYPIPLGGGEQLALTPDGRRAAVVDGLADKIHLVDLAQLGED
jgi:YVTN family beta-propeller protein